MSEEQKRPNKGRVVGRLAWRLLVPFAAMRSSVQLARESFSQTRDNLTTLKELGKQARATLTEGVDRDGETRNDSFDEAMRRRSRSSLTESELQAAFLRKKRTALGVGCFFLLGGIYAVLGGIYYHHLRGVIMGLVSLIASLPVFFTIAMDAQFRLWQLRTRRLSREEHGGLQDFMRDKEWLWGTLNPEFKRGKT